MPIYQIPAAAIRFEIARANDGSFLVVSETTGMNGVAIPCLDEAQAAEMCTQLNRGEHSGEIDVPLFWKRDV